jgi:hypothetical protein
MIPISLSERSDTGVLILLGVIGFVKDFLRIWFPERSAGRVPEARDRVWERGASPLPIAAM